MAVDAHKSQKRVIELEFQEVLSHLLWVLGTELWSPGKAARTLIHLDSPPSTWSFYKDFFLVSISPDKQLG